MSSVPILTADLSHYNRKAGIWAKTLKEVRRLALWIFWEECSRPRKQQCKVLSRHLPGSSSVARKLVWLGPSEERGREVGKVTEGCEGAGGSGRALSTTVSICFHPKRNGQPKGALILASHGCLVQVYEALHFILCMKTWDAENWGNVQSNLP